MATEERKVIIGLVSPISAGKGTVIEFLKRNSFFCSSLSDRIREELVRRGEEITREKLLVVADQLRQEFGPDVLAWRTWQIALGNRNAKVAIDSIRSLAEVNFFKSKQGFYLIGITASRKQRFVWAKKRAREGEPLTWEDFVRVDKQDFLSGDGKTGRNISACLGKSDFLIENDGTIDDLHREVTDVLEQIFANGQSS
jgi:dephospho-CoA kinase